MSNFTWTLNVEMEEDASADKDIDRILGELVGELEDKGYLIDWTEASKERDANA
tara:strand:- start:324 stop:485 length:162 start_codon:yes stop_codon:yes gene_type:complete